MSMANDLQRLKGQYRHPSAAKLYALSESTGLQKKDVALVLDELGVLIERHIKRRAVGTFTLPGLLKSRRCASRQQSRAR